MESSDDIDTNRPSFMFSPLVLPQASMQFENGTLYQGLSHRQWYYDISETQVRLGLTKQTEFSMFVPNFVLQRQPPNTLGGVSDLAEIGFKHQFLKFQSIKSMPALKNLSLAAIIGVTPPTGASRISGTGTEGVVRMPWMYQINSKWAIGGMQSFLLNNSGRGPEWEPFMMISRGFTPRIGAFMEFGGFYQRGQSPQNILHWGAVWKLNRNNQLDSQWGCGLNESSPHAFVGIGYSFRFDKLWH